MLRPRRCGCSATTFVRHLLVVVAATASITACDGGRPTRPITPKARFALNPAGAPYSIEFFLQAHQDDWQLFLGNRAASSVQTAAKVVLVYTTAGDAGTATSNPAFWQAREDGANASVAAMAPAGSWSCASQSINGHVIRRCTKANTVSYFLRLPDGNGNGQGFGLGSLTRFRSGNVTTLRAVDGTATYTSWGDLVSTLQALIAFEATGQSEANVAVHVNDWDLSLNGSDHPDHLATGELTKAALVGHAWSLFWYIGYGSLYEPPNLTPTEYALKWQLVVAYDDVMRVRMGETNIGNGHFEDWAQRTIFRSEIPTGPPPPPPPPTPPAAPTTLQATPFDATHIDLTWTDNATDEQGFRIERAPDNAGAAGTYVEIATVSTDVTTYASVGLTGNTRYWYRVRAYNTAGTSAYSGAANATTPTAPATPAAPSALGATASSGTRIDLAWTDNATNEEGFRIERAPDVGGVAGAFDEIATVGANVATYASTGLTANARYWYRVRAYNSTGPSSYSNQASATTLPPPANSFPIEFFLQAHQDDWQLFLGNRTASSVQTASKVVLVYATAGDAGTATSNPAFWQAREAAANASVDSMTTGGAWSCGNQTLNAHPILRCIKANTVSYYFRLPDGNGEGQGYGLGSLAQLRAGTRSTLSAVNGSTTYSSWVDLVSTIQALVAFEAAGQPDASVALHANDWDVTFNAGDHSDHLAAGELIRSASVGHTWNLFWYLGYPNLYQTPNLTATEYALKWKLVVAYDDVMRDRMGETNIGTGHYEDWAQRTIYRSELSTGIPVPAPTPPVAPTNLQASAVNGTRIDLTWTDNSGDELGFRIERAPDAAGVAGTYAQIASVSPNVTAYASTGLTNNTRYWYRVRAYNSVGPSASTNEANATTLYPPAAPTSLQATAVSSVIIDLTWVDNAVNEASYRVERAPDVGGVPGTFASVATLGANVTTYRSSSLAAATAYWFRVRAQNVAGNSAFTPAVVATTMVFVPPSNLTATAYLVGTTRNVDLRWTPGTELTVDIFRNGTRITAARVNDGGPFNNKPAASLGSPVNYQVCAAGKTGAANCTAVVPASF